MFLEVNFFLKIAPFKIQFNLLSTFKFKSNKPGLRPWQVVSHYRVANWQQPQG